LAESRLDPLPRVLVADPDVGFRRTVSALLEADRFACHAAADGVETLGLASAQPFDLIIANVSMPRASGPSFVTKLKETTSARGAALIVVSSEALGDELVREIAPDALLVKPINPEELVREARRLTARKAGASRPEERSLEVTATETQVIRKYWQTPDAPVKKPTERYGETESSPLRPMESTDWVAGADTDSALSGRLDAVPPAEVVTILHRTGRSGKLEVACEEGRSRGIIDLADGEVFASYVEVDGIVVASGEAALARIFAWHEGSFRLKVGARHPSSGTSIRRNIERPTRSVIAEASGAFHETAELANERLGPFEVLEMLSEPPRITVHRARRQNDATKEEGRRPGSLVRLVVVERPPFRRPHDLEGLKRLSVPGAARLFAWGELPDGRLWYETELPPGVTLEEQIRTRGPFSVEQALSLFEKVLETLHAARQAGFCHGGLDAHRIILVAGSRPVLLDLGLARELATLDENAAVSATAPEVWQGRPPDALSDLYSAGALLFFTLTGRYPFEDDNPLVVGNNHLHAAPPTLAAAGLAQASPELEGILSLLLAKTPTARYATAEVARAALESARTRDKEKERKPPTENFAVPAPSGYRFIRKIGKGGSGEVYEALHETLGRVVAVKVIRPGLTEEAESRARFIREARMAASLVHPGVVQVFDAREEGGRLYLVMEFIDGEALRARLAREGALPEAEAVSISASLLEALAIAHERGIIHRDVKPDNLLMSKTGRIKVTDFGLAMSLNAPENLTEHGTVLGTPLYMSPEQCQAKATDERSDLYSVGATLYHMLSGRPPFVGETVNAIMRKHVDELPVPLTIAAPSVSRGVGSVVERLLAKRPEDRFANAREVLNALFISSVSAANGAPAAS
jgi:serine/threonine protein kinase/CheY-like chemotaxis protein